MARPFLFGGSTAAATSKYLVEFKAGKMVMRGTTVSPINRKGSVYINQSDDGLMHFCWKDRTSGETEDDLIIFPDDAEFKRVNSCKTGRVFMLKFKSSDKKNFYWMQEPKDDKDEEYCTKINEYLNNPPAPGSRGGGSGSGGGSSGLGGLSDLGSLNDADLQNLLNNMSPQQLVQMLGGVTGLPSAGSLAGLLGSPSGGGERQSRRERSSGATSATATSTTNSGQGAPKSSSSVSSTPAGAIQLSDFQNIISGLSVPAAAGGSATNGAQNDLNIDLAASINYEALQPLLLNEDFMKKVKDFLPPSVDASGNTAPVSPSEVPEQLAATVSSPQFQQALSVFSAALQSGQLGPLISEFNLGKDCVDAATKGDLEAFVKGLEKKGSANQDKKDDEMALD